MEDIRSWAVSVIFSVAIAAVIGMLSLDSSGGKAVRFIVSVFLLLVFLSPLCEFDFEAENYTNGIDSYLQEYKLEEQVEEQVKENLSAQVISSVSAYLDLNDIKCSKISVNVDIDENKNITINRIVINAAAVNAESKIKLIEYIKDNYEVEAEIIVDGVKNE